MARSKRRKTALAKAAQARRDRHEAMRARKAHLLRLWDLAHEISLANPPDLEASARTPAEIDQWMREDPLAPLVHFRYPPIDEEGRPIAGEVLISVNNLAIQRELRRRGIDEAHPDWEPAFHLTQEIVMDVAELAVTAPFWI